MKKAVYLLAAALLLSLVFMGCKRPFDLSLQREMERQHIAALSVLIFKNDTILYENCLGTSQIEQDIPLDYDHLFLLASLSKVITATALLQLYDQGRFFLDDPINDYLPFRVVHPRHSSAITFRMLLTHTSAIADGSALDNQYFYGKDSPVALDYFLENYLVPNGRFYNPVENFYRFEPGTRYEYSNTGAALVALLVQEISGTDFNTYCKTHIFAPLGMANTSWRLDEITGTIVQPCIYVNNHYRAIEHYTFTDYPNGGLRSTARDLFKFLSTFVQNGTENPIRLLKKETAQAMITPQIPALDNEVGLFLFLLDSGSNLWGHDGGEEGVSTIMGFNPFTETGVVILTNQGSAVLDTLLKEAYQLGVELSGRL